MVDLSIDPAIMLIGRDELFLGAPKQKEPPHGVSSLLA